MRPWLLLTGGAILVVAGLLFALLEIGVLLLADCGPDCQARGEQVVVAALAVAGLLVAVGGVVLLRKGVAARRA